MAGFNFAPGLTNLEWLVSALLAIALLVILWDRRRVLHENADLQDAYAELQVINDENHYNAHHDDLTGLPNRRFAHGYLDTLLDTQRPVGVVLIDVDGFKSINDTYGHQCGDEALAFLAQRLYAADLPPESLVARVSGDEFAVAIDGGSYTVQAAAHAVMASLTADKFTYDDRGIDVNVSIGTAVADDADCTTSALMRRADHARYHAKRGAHRIVAWRPEMAMPAPQPQPHRRAFRDLTN